MKRLLILLFFPFFLAYSQSYPGTNGEWVLDSNKSDEFTNGFDNQKWEKGGLWFNCSKEVAFRDENVSVINGVAIITAKKEQFYAPNPICYSYNGTYQYEYTTGAFQSKFFIGNNSFVEIMAKTLNYESDMTSAIWFQEKPVFKRNPNVEIDLMETLKSYIDPQMFSSAVHLWVRDQTDNSDYHMGIRTETNTNRILSDKFHKYALERNEELLRFYFDENLIWEINIMDDSSYPTGSNFFPIEYRPYLTGQDRRLIFSLEGHTLEGQTHPVDNFPQNFEIDYVRTYKKKYCPSNIEINTQISEVNDYQANNKITASSNINSNLIVNFKANKIQLKDGFHVTGNNTGKFNAKVEPCVLSGSKSKNDKLEVNKIINKEDLSLTPTLSPNPTLTVLNVENIENIREWKLVDINGKIMNSGIVNQSVQNKITINTSMLLPGIYYFNAIMTNGELFQKTIMKN